MSLYGNTQFNCYAKQILYSYLESSFPRLFFLSLALTSIVGYFYLSSTNWTSVLAEEAAFMNEHVKKDTGHLSYYGSIFSNLSRGLPIAGGDSNSEPPTVEEKANSSSTVQGS